TVVMSSISILSSIAAIIYSAQTYNFDNPYLKPKFGTNPYTIIPISVVVIVGSAIAIFTATRVLQWQPQARTGLTVLAGITIFFGAFASLLLVGIPWLATGIIVVLNLHKSDATAWFGDRTAARY